MSPSPESLGSLLLMATPIVFAIAALFYLISKRWPTAALLSILLLLLVHEYAMRLVTNLLTVSDGLRIISSLWKEGALLGYAAARLPQIITSIRESRQRLAYAFLLMFVAASLFSLLQSPSLLSGIAALRDYLEPLAFFFFAVSLAASKSKVRTSMIAWLVLGGLLAGLAIWQSFRWTAETYVAWGFGQPSSQVGIPIKWVGGWQIRPPSTFTGPNELGAHMGLLALASLVWVLASHGWKRLLGVGLTAWFVTALVLTYSRSALLGFGLALLALLILFIQRRGDWYHRLGEAKGIGIALALVLAGLFLLQASGMLRLLSRTALRLSNQYHIVDTVEAIGFVWHHPMGIGLGSTGPRQGIGALPIPIYHVEGSLLQIAVETGVIGLIGYLGFVGISLARSLSRMVSDKAIEWQIVMLPVSGWIMVLTTLIFLPLMQAFPLMAWLYTMLGVAAAQGRLAKNEHAGTQERRLNSSLS